MKGKESKLVLTLISLFFTKTESASPTQKNWRCSGCSKDKTLEKLQKLLIKSVKDGNSATYYALDMEWLDAIITDVALVDVAIVPSFVSTEAAVKLTSLSSANDEWYHVLAVVSPGVDNSATRAMDDFLTHNPCWIPLREPLSGVRRARPGEPGSSLRTGDLDDVSLVIRLPSRSFGATCRLFTALVHQQFRDQCQFDDDSMAVHIMANIGYGHIVRHLVNGFVAAAMPPDPRRAKVFVAPMAEEYISRTVPAVDRRSGSNVSVRISGGWAWADASLCSHETLLHDPWACSFLPFTNCSDRFLSAHIEHQHPHFYWSTPLAYLEANASQGGPAITQGLRDQLNEAPWLTQEQWALSRVHAFLQRPNHMLRAEMRHCFRNIVNAKQLNDVSLIDIRNGHSHSKGRSSESGHSGFLANGRPCLAMHIRHNDASIDARGDRPIDRSLFAHVNASLPFLAENDITDIFVATDNATIVETVATLYPQYNWFIQRRPMSKTVTFYQMFTEPMHSKASGVHIPGHDTLFNSSSHVATGKGGVSGGRPRYSVLTDLAHVQVDIRAAAMCSALTGAGDSGLTQLMHTTKYSMTRKGREKTKAKAKIERKDRNDSEATGDSALHHTPFIDITQLSKKEKAVK